MGYKYYDTPEGQDAFKKLGVTMKYAGAFGLAYSTLDVLTLSHPKGYGNVIGRYAYFTFPMLGMAAAFTTTTYIATNARGKDDKLNYVFGALAASGVCAAWQKSPIAGLWGGIFFSTAAILKKSSIQDGWVFFPEVKPMTGTVNSHKSDWSLTKDRPKTQA